MKKVNFLSKNGQDITISAVINFPQGFDESNVLENGSKAEPPKLAGLPL